MVSVLLLTQHMIMGKSAFNACLLALLSTCHFVDQFLFTTAHDVHWFVFLSFQQHDPFINTRGIRMNRRLSSLPQASRIVTQRWSLRELYQAGQEEKIRIHHPSLSFLSPLAGFPESVVLSEVSGTQAVQQKCRKS